MDLIDIALAVNNAYPSAPQDGTGYLVLNDRGVVVWADLACSRLFCPGGQSLVGNTMDVFLPGGMYDLLIQSTFKKFRDDMGSAWKKGNPRTIQGYDFQYQPIEFILDLAPLTVCADLFAVALITPLRSCPPLQRSTDLVIKNDRLQIVFDFGSVIGRMFLGVFDFFINQIFGKSRTGRISSGIATFATFFCIFYLSYLLFDSRFGTKPTHQNWNIEQPPTEPTDDSEPKSNPKTESNNSAKREGVRW